MNKKIINKDQTKDIQELDFTKDFSEVNFPDTQTSAVLGFTGCCNVVLCK